MHVTRARIQMRSETNSQMGVPSLKNVLSNIYSELEKYCSEVKVNFYYEYGKDAHDAIQIRIRVRGALQKNYS